jgi:hypothetical protein
MAICIGFARQICAKLHIEDKWLRKLYTQKVILKEIVQFPNLQKFVNKLKFNE